MQFGESEWLPKPPSGVRMYCGRSELSLTAVKGSAMSINPNSVPSSMSSVEKSPRPCIGLFLMVMLFGRGLYGKPPQGGLWMW